MRITRVTKANPQQREDFKGVYREKSESMQAYLAAYFDALVNDKMPDTPYRSDDLGDCPLSRQLHDFFSVAALEGSLREKQHQKRRTELAALIRSQDYTLIRNSWGVITGINKNPPHAHNAGGFKQPGNGERYQGIPTP
jgi:hypothetical protein